VHACTVHLQKMKGKMKGESQWESRTGCLGEGDSGLPGLELEKRHLDDQHHPTRPLHLNLEVVVLHSLLAKLRMPISHLIFLPVRLKGHFLAAVELTQLFSRHRWYEHPPSSELGGGSST